MSAINSSVIMQWCYLGRDKRGHFPCILCGLIKFLVPAKFSEIRPLMASKVDQQKAIDLLADTKSR